jgi:ABC-2 type transport system permease protein
VRTNYPARLLRLWRLAAFLDWLWITSDWRKFLSYYFSTMIIQLSSVTAALLLAARFDGIGPWTRHEIVFMLGYALVVGELREAFFGFNIGFISRRIGRGQLDHVLLQPQPLWVSLLTEGFTFTGATALVPGLGLLIWGTIQLQIAVTPAWLLLLGINVVASLAIVMAFAFIWGSAAFWAPRAAEEITSTTNGALADLRVFPLDGLSPAPLLLLTTVLPAGLVAWLPSRALVGLSQSPLEAALTPVAAIAFCLVAWLVFRLGMREYARTGSQRYLSYGHRR